MTTYHDEAEAAFYEAEMAKQLQAEAEGRGWDWEPIWGQQPHDEHCRDRLRNITAGPLAVDSAALH